MSWMHAHGVVLLLPPALALVRFIGVLTHPQFILSGLVEWLRARHFCDILIPSPVDCDIQRGMGLQIPEFSHPDELSPMSSAKRHHVHIAHIPLLHTGHGNTTHLAPLLCILILQPSPVLSTNASSPFESRLEAFAPNLSPSLLRTQIQHLHIRHRRGQLYIFNHPSPAFFPFGY